MTDAVRQELAPSGIHVAALHVGFMDTDMADFVPGDQKDDHAVVAKLALDGRFAGEREIPRRRVLARNQGPAVRHPGLTAIGRDW
jgi:NAD(P)-dependent dehydrogenase (short-subunit alcohol dehydrogenase family)